MQEGLYVQGRANRALMLSIFAGFLSAGALLGLLLVANSDCGFIGCTGAAPLGWITTLVAGSVIGLVTVLLLRSKSTYSDTEMPIHSSICVACGSEIGDGWRMCPHCGEMLDCVIDLSSSGDTVAKNF